MIIDGIELYLVMEEMALASPEQAQAAQAQLANPQVANQQAMQQKQQAQPLPPTFLRDVNDIKKKLEMLTKAEEERKKEAEKPLVQQKMIDTPKASVSPKPGDKDNPVLAAIDKLAANLNANAAKANTQTDSSDVAAKIQQNAVVKQPKNIM